jgi:hypothetical protein
MILMWLGLQVETAYTNKLYDCNKLQTSYKLNSALKAVTFHTCRICATNIFEKQGGKWLMVLHQGGPAIPTVRRFVRGP